MSDLYAAPLAPISEPDRARVVTRWRFLAYAAAMLCLLPVVACLFVAVDANIYVRVVVLVYAAPWAATFLLLILLKQSALWPLALAELLTVVLAIGTRPVVGGVILMGYAITVLAIVLWLRKRRALI